MYEIRYVFKFENSPYMCMYTYVVIKFEMEICIYILSMHFLYKDSGEGLEACVDQERIKVNQ